LDRDDLQNESTVLPVATKAEFAGNTVVESTGSVHPG